MSADRFHDQVLAAAGVLSATIAWHCEGDRDGLDEADRAAADLVGRYGADAATTVATVAVDMLCRALSTPDDPSGAERIHALLLAEVEMWEQHRMALGRRDRLIASGRMHRACDGCQVDVFEWDDEEVDVFDGRDAPGRCCWCGRISRRWGHIWPRLPGAPGYEHVPQPTHCDGDHQTDDAEP